jgi:DNA-binding LacI/PurR family transcriptional regulator
MSLEEVAKRAKVSTATVSRVLNDVAGVRNATRARVLRAAEELKYHPNLHARTLAGGRSSTLGMIVSNMENPFFLDIFKSAESHARERGYDIILANTDYNSEKLVKNIRHMIGWRVAGLALVVSEMDQSLTDQLMELNIPVVFYDVGEPRKNITNIAVNYARGIAEVVHYLHELGHQRMAFVSHHPSLGPLSAREQAFRETVEAFVPKIQWCIAASTDTLEGGRQAAREILNSGLNATTIMCVNDFMALGVMRELRESGIRVPADISVTGFDNISLAEIANPALSTLNIPREKIGQLMSQALTAGDCMETNKFMIEPEFIIRGTTGPAAVTAFQIPASTAV